VTENILKNTQKHLYTHKIIFISFSAALIFKIIMTTKMFTKKQRRQEYESEKAIRDQMVAHL
jgi:hypothetical protein